MGKKKRIYPAAVLVGFVLAAGCSQVKVLKKPGPGPYYRSLRVKANLKDLAAGRRQGIKILLKYDDKNARMLFVGPPLNKVYAKLVVKGEKALLVNARKKRYWKGDFNTLIKTMWDLDLDYREFERLLEQGVYPGRRLARHGLSINLEKDPDTGRPEKITVEGEQFSLRLKISGRKILAGKLDLSLKLARLTPADLDRLLDPE